MAESTALETINGGRNTLAPSSTIRGSFLPTSLAEAMQFAKYLSESDIVPKDFIGKPGNILVAMQWGMEIGLPPLQALQSIAVVNGRPTIWGDAQLALVMGHPAYVKHDEGIKGEGDAMVAWHTILRRNQEPYTVEFSVADAKTAKLWGKTGRDGQPTPWVTSPKRMLKLRARAFALRDKFPDALRGIISREEAIDMVDLRAADEGEAVSAPATAKPAVVATITDDQARNFFRTWRLVGKHASAEAKEFLEREIGVTDSRKIPSDLYDRAMKWAALAADPLLSKKIDQAFDLLATTEKQRQTLLTEHEGKLPELAAALEAQLSED